MTANRPAPRGALLSRLRLPVHCAIIITAIATLLPVVPLKARELIVDQRNTSDTTTYKTLKAAAAALQPGDTLVIAKGSGPYRETLRIQKSGTPEAPITIEGNGETITGFVPLDSFQRADNNAAAPHIARLPHPWPLVLAYQGRRVLQNPATGRLEIPSFPASALTLHDDNQTIELAPGTPTTGWETSTLTNAVQLRDVSYHTYRNLTATGALNDGFNLHGAGTGLLFENITAAQNLDEGFSAHGTIECEIRGGDFWGNDNGLGNVAQSRLRATDLRLHHNLGWGLWLGGQACADLTRVSAWNNGATQIRFDQNTTGTCTDVLAWPPAWTHTRPWTAYKEAARQTKSIPLVGLARTATAQWNGLPRLVTASSDLPPVTSDIHLPKPVAQTLDPEPTAAATLTRLILSAAAAGQKNVRLPAGIHKLDSTLEFKKLKNIEIDGTGVTLLMTRTHRQTILRLRECADITLRGLTLDYAPLPFTQATVTRATRTPDGDTLIEFSIHDGYPDLTPDYAKTSAHFFTPDGRRHPGSYDLNRLADLHPLSPRLGQARLSRHLPSDLAPGDMIALDRRSLDGAGAVAVHTATGPVTFEDITLHASPGMGFLGRYCTDTVTFRRVTIRPGPPPPGATRPRLLSTNADGINFVHCRRGPLIEHSDLSGMGDDSLNVHGFLFPLLRVLSPTRLLTLYKNGRDGFTLPMRPGDTLRFYNPGDFAPAGHAPFAAIMPLATSASPADITADEMKAFFPTYRSGDYTFYQIDLQTPAPATTRPGQWFDLPALNSPGYIIRHNYFHDHRARGLRLMADNGIVEDNRFERLAKSAITIGPELGHWREAGWVQNVRIARNTLRDIGVDYSLAAPGSYVPGAISIFVRTERAAPPYPNGNHGIIIEQNHIENTSTAGIHAYAARDLVIRQNTLRNTNLARLPATSDPRTQLRTTGPITLQDVTGATIENNNIQSNTTRSNVQTNPSP